MSADGSIDLFFGDAIHVFRFAIGQFRELQEKVNMRRLAIGAPLVGPMTLLKSLQANDAWPDDIRDVLRIGLNGGGMSQSDTHRLLVNHFDTTPPLTHMRTAHVALLAGLVGGIGDDVGSKKKPQTETATPHPSPSPGSTATALQ
jgi:hypothetical protein